MKAKWTQYLVLFLLLLAAGSTEAATDLRVVVVEGNPTSGTNAGPVNGAEVCLVATDGSTRRQLTGGTNATVFTNVPVGNQTLNVHATGFNQKSVTTGVKPDIVNFQQVALVAGSNPPTPCNTVAGRDLTARLQQVTPIPVTGKTIQYRLTFANEGQASASAATAKIVFPAGFGTPSGAGPGMPCAASGGGGAPATLTCSTSSIAGGATKLIDISVPTPPVTQAEVFTIQAEADPQNSVIEGNENNNRSPFVSTKVSVAPDLTVAVQQTTPNPVTGTSISYRVTLNNDGNATANNVRVNVQFPVGFGAPTGGGKDFSCSPSGSGGAPVLFGCTIASIAGATQKEFSVTIPTPDFSGFGVKAEADPANIVTEGNENNNTTEARTNIASFRDLDPDLAGSDQTVDVGKEYAYAVTVKNNGNLVVANAIARLTIPDDAEFVRIENSTFSSCPRSGQILSCQANSIPAGGLSSIRVIARPKPTTPGGRQMLFSIKVDPDNIITENNETNNTAFVTTTTDIPPSDLQVVNFEVHAVGIYVRVRNNGPNRANSSKVRVTIPSGCVDNTNKCNAPNYGGAATGSGGFNVCLQPESSGERGCGANPCPITGLDPGEQTDRMVFTVDCVYGTHAFTVCADHDKIIPETDEANCITGFVDFQ